MLTTKDFCFMDCFERKPRPKAGPLRFSFQIYFFQTILAHYCSWFLTIQINNFDMPIQTGTNSTSFFHYSIHQKQSKPGRFPKKAMYCSSSSAGFLPAYAPKNSVRLEMESAGTRMMFRYYKSQGFCIHTRQIQEEQHYNYPRLVISITVSTMYDALYSSFYR